MKSLLILVALAGVVGYMGVTLPSGEHFMIRATESKGFHVVVK